MSKFKVGDRVRCVNDLAANEGLEAGLIYNVTKVDEEVEGEPDFIVLDGVFGWNNANRFELVQEPPKEEPKVTYKFKVGDKVRCISAPPYTATIKLGGIYTVKEVADLELIYLEEFTNGYCPSRFELFLEAPQGSPFVAPSAVNPNHYTQFAIQPLTYIRANNLSFTRGNIVKYATRAGHKDGEDAIQDLEKIIRYAEAEIEAIKRERDVANGIMNTDEMWARPI